MTLVGANHLADALPLLLFLRHLRRRLLRVAPVIENADLMQALQGRRRRDAFFSLTHSIEIVHSVLVERNAGIAALLRAPVDQTYLADVEITRAGATTPVVRLTFSNAVLKPVQTGVVLVAHFLDLLKDVFLFFRKWL